MSSDLLTRRLVARRVNFASSSGARRTITVRVDTDMAGAYYVPAKLARRAGPSVRARGVLDSQSQ